MVHRVMTLFEREEEDTVTRRNTSAEVLSSGALDNDYENEEILTELDDMHRTRRNSMQLTGVRNAKEGFFDLISHATSMVGTGQAPPELPEIAGEPVTFESAEGDNEQDS